MDFPDPKRLPEKSDGDDAYTHQIRGSNAKKKRDALLVEAVRRAAKGEKNGDLCLPGLSLGDDGVARVCEIAAGRTIVTLGAVDLSDNDVRERGAAALADAILAARGLSGAALAPERSTRREPRTRPARSREHRACCATPRCANRPAPRTPRGGPVSAPRTPLFALALVKGGLTRLSSRPAARRPHRRKPTSALTEQHARG